MTAMRLLLGSGGFRGEERRDALRQAMRNHFGDIRRLLFVPYAIADGDAYVEALNKAELNAGYELIGLHRESDPVKAIQEAEGIYVGGGNTFRLIRRMQAEGLLEPIRSRVAAGMPYLGISAGTNVACPTMQTTNDMPIVHPASFEALGLVPFQVNTHYYAGQIHVRLGEREYEEHFGETRDDRIREFHEENEAPVLGLWESGLLRRDGERLDLLRGAVRLFRKGELPVDLDEGADLSDLLGGS